MTPADKDKLTKAFNNAVASSPYADEPLEGIRTQEGAPFTRRMLIESLLQDPKFFTLTDEVIASGKTLDYIIERFEAGMKTSNARPKP